jgi:hypothetical protein
MHAEGARVGGPSHVCLVLCESSTDGAPGSGQQELESCIFLPWLPSVPAFGSVAAVRAAKRTFCVGG